MLRRAARFSLSARGNFSGQGAEIKINDKAYKQLHTAVKRNGRISSGIRRNYLDIVNRRQLGGKVEEGKSPYPSQAYAFGREVCKIAKIVMTFM